MSVLELKQSNQSQIQCVDVFNYSDFRAYLKDYVAFKKNVKAGYSIKVLSMRSGVGRTLLSLIISGKRNCSVKVAHKLATACNLTEWEHSYFVDLVQYNQCQVEHLRTFFEKRLKSLRANEHVHLLEGAEQILLSRWYTIALVEMIRLPGFQEDAEWIASKLIAPVDPIEIKDTLKRLEAFGLVRRNEHNILVEDSKVILGRQGNIPREVMQKFHEDNIPIGITSMKTIPSEFREISGTSFVVNKAKIVELKEKLQEIRMDFLQSAQETNDPNAVYQLNIQFFPVVDLGDVQ